MRDPLFALLLALAWFGAFNIPLSLLASALGRFLGRTDVAARPVRAAWILFALKVAPAAISVFFTVGLFLPAHWRWEPARAHESAGYSIALFAISGAAIIAFTVRRAVRDTLATSTIARRWRALAREDGTRAALGLPIFFLPDPSPVMSLVGIVNPRLFVADEVEAELTPEELEVSLAHEVAHARAGDNLKRVIAAWCPDVLGGPLGRDLAARWRAATEFAADAAAVGGNGERAVALASALVKVARLTPRDIPTPVAVSHIHHQALLAARVERLLRLGDPRPASRRLAPSLFAAAAVIVLTAVVATHHPWLAVHWATESLIRVLP